MTKITFGIDEFGDWIVYRNGKEIGSIVKEDDQEYKIFHDVIDTHVECFDTLEDAMQDINENWA